MGSQIDSSHQVSRRLILRCCPAREEVGNFAAHRRGQQTSSYWLDSAQKWQYRITWDISADASVWYTEDHVAGCCYIQIASRDTAYMSDLLHAAESEMDTRGRDELLREVDSADEPISHGVALVLLGVSAPVRFDEEIYSRISDEFYNEYEEVRDMAVWASSYAPYKEYRPDLEELRDNDPIAKVRNRARTVLRIFDSMGIESE